MLRAADEEGALEAADRAIEIDPRDAYAHRLRAECLLAMGRLEEAMAAADRALELDPLDASAHLARAEALRSLGRLDDAAAAESRARELGPSAPLDGPGVGFRFVERAR